MTCTEFKIKLDEMFSRHKMIAKSNPKSLNELVYVLRMEGDVDYCICTNDGLCIPSVRNTFIPTDWLARKVESVDYEEVKEELDGEVYESFVVIIDLI